jgi:hypothetical protein
MYKQGNYSNAGYYGNGHQQMEEEQTENQDNGGGYVENEGPKTLKNRQSITPVTIKQILEAEKISDTEFSISNREVKDVCLIGAIHKITPGTNTLTYYVEDGTGALDVKEWFGNSDDNETIERKNSRVIGSYIRVVGMIKDFNEKKSVFTFNPVQIITNYNDITHHFLKTIVAYLHNTRGPLNQYLAQQQQQQQQHQQQQQPSAMTHQRTPMKPTPSFQPPQQQQRPGGPGQQSRQPLQARNPQQQQQQQGYHAKSNPRQQPGQQGQYKQQPPPQRQEIRERIQQFLGEGQEGKSLQEISQTLGGMVSQAQLKEILQSMTDSLVYQPDLGFPDVYAMIEY